MKKYCFFVFTLIAYSVQAAPYFDAATIPPTLITPPVTAQQEQVEIDLIIQLQQQANLADIEKANRERDVKPEMITLAVDTTLTRDRYPVLYGMLDRVRDTSRSVNDAAKNFWQTKRPYLADTRIKALIEAHNNPAYPSGHTSGNYVWAYVLSMIIPEKRAMFFARAEEIAQHRVLVGMHFPYDLAGGRELALLVVGALVQNADFQRDLSAARREWMKK